MQVEWSVRSIKDMRRLSPGDRELVIAKIEQYAEFPEALANQVSSLTNSDYLRLRVGNYRVIFSVLTIAQSQSCWCCEFAIGVREAYD